MGWEAQFEAIETNLEHENQLRQEGEIAERVTAEQAGVLLAARFASAEGGRVTVHLRHGVTVRGLVDLAGAGFIAITEPTSYHIVTIGALSHVEQLSPWATPTGPGAVPRPTLGSALRGLGACGDPVTAVTPTASLTGRITRVGADHLDIAAIETPRLVTIPFIALLHLHTLPR